MPIKLPRGRIPQNPTGLKLYIQKVAILNGITYEAAENAVLKTDTAKAVVTNHPEIHSLPLPHSKHEKEETDEEIIERITARFNMMYTITRGCCTGAVRSVIVSGAGGVGKSYGIERILETYKEQKGIKSEIVKAVITPVNLYKLLYKHQEEDHVVVLDDADQIFWDENAVGILKAALDTSITRKVSYMSESNALKSEGIETSFYYHGSMIFITNIDFQSYVDGGKGRLQPHLQALMTRAMYLDLKLHTQREMLLWIKHLIPKEGVLVKYGLSLTQQKDVLAFMTEHLSELRNLSIRTALKIAQFVKMDPNGWKKMAREVECK